MRHHSKNMALIASLTWSGIGASLIIEGSTTTTVFERYTEEVFPSLTGVDRDSG